MLKAYNLTSIINNKLIFKNINLTLFPGNCLILQGANGSGKSTLLKILAGLNQPTQGRLYWKNSSLTLNTFNFDQYLTRIHFLSEKNALIPDQTAFENLSFWKKVYDIDDNTKITDILKFFSINPETNASNLSQGQRKKLALSRLLLIPKMVWILDEPLNGLDKNSIKLIENLINYQSFLGGIIILSTHQNLKIRNATSLRL